MHCATNLRELSSTPVGNAQRDAKLRALVERFKDHPGLGVWKGVDEPEWGNHPVEPMVRARELINQVDGRHPIFVVQAPRGTVETLKAYDPTYDITGVDVYPVGYPPGQHSAEANKNLSMVGDFTKRMMEVAGGRKPGRCDLPISLSGTINPGKTLRMPTFPQTR